MQITISNKVFVPPSIEKGEEVGHLMVYFSVSASWGSSSSNLRLDVPENTSDAEIEQAIRGLYKAATPDKEESEPTTKLKGKK